MKLKPLINEIDFSAGKTTHISKKPLLHLTYSMNRKYFVPNTEQDKELIIDLLGNKYGFAFDAEDPTLRGLKFEDLHYLIDEYNVLITT